ncbi:hypothetical protein [Nocardia australiensis]|uniref:hypothetical protein n=1 Tax=Nocardia australiensis TaxID=2887191 RepID=UPI001D136871|nr:hypothetical protein [Nocardia australiensis]
MRHRPNTGSPRGCLAGVMVGALVIAAHGAAGGGYPSSAEAAMVLLVATVAGFAAGGLPIGRGRAGVTGVLALGQLTGHCVLSGLLGHDHGSGLAAAVPTDGMLAAHLVATLACATLILLAERLYVVASGAIRAALTPPARQKIAGPSRWPDNAARHYRFHPSGAIGPRAPPVPA